METAAESTGVRAEAKLEGLLASHLDLVYSSALRQIRDPHLTEDIAQTVFLIAAEKAPGIPPQRLPGWLITVTRYTALAQLRAKRRRQKHERAAALSTPIMDRHDLNECVELHIDEALAALSPGDRDVIIYRYFRDQSVAHIAGVLGIRENAASKRIERALTRLRRYFLRRGIDANDAALAVAINATVIRPPPRALAGKILSASATGAGPAVGASIPLTVMLMAASTQVKFGFVVLLILMLSAGGYIVMHSGQPGPAAVPPAPATTEAVLRNTFPNGAHAELLAVGSADGAGKWWSPDGSATAAKYAGGDFSSQKDPYNEPRVTRQFAVRLTQLPATPDAVYLLVSGAPRTLSPVAMRRDDSDPSLYYGAALLYAEQPNARLAWVSYSTLPWNRLTLDATGKLVSPSAAELSPFLEEQLGSNGVREKNGHALLDTGMEFWGGDYEFTATAVAKDGSRHPGVNRVTGLITGGDQYANEFDLPAEAIERIEIAVRQFDQMAEFADISLREGNKTSPHLNELGARTGGRYFDKAFYTQLFSRELGGSIQTNHLSAATEAADKLIAELNTRRAHLESEKNPDAFLAGRAVAIVTQLRAALAKNDREAAIALLQADSASGTALRNAMQRLAQDP